MSFLVSLLVDVTSFRIYLVSTKPHVINLLHSGDGSTLNPCLWDPHLVVGGPPKITTLGGLAKEPSESWTDYIFDTKGRRIVRDTEVPPITPEFRSAAKLFNLKAEVVGFIAGALHASRKKLSMPAEYGEAVRQIKHAEALLFRKSGYDPEKMSECIFVWQYAEVHGITPREAADRIILEADLFAAELWKSEGIKMRYWNRILETKDPDQVPRILEDFKREFWVNALV